jgi:hypothetical protein
MKQTRESHPVVLVEMGSESTQSGCRGLKPNPAERQLDWSDFLLLLFGASIDHRGSLESFNLGIGYRLVYPEIGSN